MKACGEYVYENERVKKVAGTFTLQANIHIPMTDSTRTAPERVNHNTLMSRAELILSSRGEKIVNSMQPSRV